MNVSFDVLARQRTDANETIAACSRGSGYVKRHIDAGKLHLAPDAPKFLYPAWAVWRDDLDQEVDEVVRPMLAATLKSVD